MNRRSLLVSAAAACTVALFFGSASAWWSFSKDDDSNENLTEIMWDDLIPDGFIPPENPLMTMTNEEIDKLMDGSEESNAELMKLEAAFNYAPVNEKMNGIRVKLPAYVTPLEYDGQSTAREFLLVPYVGACMHSPPPPSNQIVHAISPEVMDIPQIYDPVWAVGTISAESVTSVLAESGYRLEIEKLIPYTVD